MKNSNRQDKSNRGKTRQGRIEQEKKLVLSKAIRNWGGIKRLTGRKKGTSKANKMFVFKKGILVYGNAPGGLHKGITEVL